MELQLGEDRAIRPLVTSRLEQVVVDLVALLVVVVVADVERRAGVHAVSAEQVEREGLVVVVVLGDLPLRPNARCVGKGSQGCVEKGSPSLP